MIAAAGATAGATLMPTVMNAQIIAAKADRTCVRAYCVMLISFSMFRTIPGMRTALHGLCQNQFIYKKQYIIVYIRVSHCWNKFIYWEIIPIFGSDGVPIAA